MEEDSIMWFCEKPIYQEHFFFPKLKTARSLVKSFILYKRIPLQFKIGETAEQETEKK